MCENLENACRRWFRREDVRIALSHLHPTDPCTSPRPLPHAAFLTQLDGWEVMLVS